MTAYICIRCRKTWEVEDGDVNPIPSGSLCKPCLKESLTTTYRNRQTREGNFDCFGKASGYCDQSQCKYREICLIES